MSPERALAKPFTKGNVLTAVCVFLMWTMLSFSLGAKLFVQWLLNELRPDAEGKPVNRFLAIVGSSWSGKSSVTCAGLVAALRLDDI